MKEWGLQAKEIHDFMVKHKNFQKYTFSLVSIYFLHNNTEYEILD